MTITATLTQAQFNRMQSSLALDKLNAKKKAVKWFIENLLIEHFQAGNQQRYGYTPNKPSYQEWKRKHGLNPNIMLVLSGELKKAVMSSAKVNPQAKLVVSCPNYSIYQIELGRDFLEPNSREMGLINRQYKKYLLEIRKKTLSTVLQKF